MRVPDLEDRHTGQLPHRLAIGAHRPAYQAAAFIVAEAVLAPGDLDARGQALDVPLPRPGVALVEVVEAEDQMALRCPEDPEVRQVRVAAQLGRQA